MWLWTAVAATVSAIGLVPASPASALPSDFTPYQIINRNHTNLCMAAKDDPPQVGTTQIVQKTCDRTDRLEGWYNTGSNGPTPILQRSPVGIMWLTQGTWCIGGDVSSPGHAVKIVGTYLDDSDCLSFFLIGNAGSGVNLQVTSTNLCLVVSGGSSAVGAPLVFWPCDSTPDWSYPQPVPDIHGGNTSVGFPNSACTLGFNVYDEFNDPYFVTAGHCQEGIASQNWLAEGGPAASVMKVPVGQTVAWAVQSTDGTNANPGGDWALVQYINAGYTAYGIMSYPNSSGWTDITGSDDPYTCTPPSCNQVVYFNGMRTGFHSGHIVRIDAQISVPPSTYPDGTSCAKVTCHVYRNIIEVDFCLNHGDSGGPLITNDIVNGTNLGPHIALGTLVAADLDSNGNCIPGGHSYFVRINSIFSQITQKTGLHLHVY